MELSQNKLRQYPAINSMTGNVEIKNYHVDTKWSCSLIYIRRLEESDIKFQPYLREKRLTHSPQDLMNFLTEFRNLAVRGRSPNRLLFREWSNARSRVGILPRWEIGLLDPGDRTNFLRAIDLCPCCKFSIGC
ncbi:hypothetical protein TNCV_4596281 [Trichonephila clavipes]|uniref:Uncharacterized protein n=1 Tax=Trichonephila clavipes TaxID=2585209 RepID=A0A8X6WFL7_TRICX|nr:hypothetical protein TNCV_4596281 [Trichonephila clavipes]